MALARGLSGVRGGGWAARALNAHWSCSVGVCRDATANEQRVSHQAVWALGGVWLCGMS